MKCLSTHSGSTREKAVNYEDINCLERFYQREKESDSYTQYHACGNKFFQKSYYPSYISCIFRFFYAFLGWRKPHFGFFGHFSDGEDLIYELLIF
jgi:hypothetical protein